MSPVATDGMDGNGLKLENIGRKNWPIFSCFDATCFKSPQEMVCCGQPSLIKFI